MRAPPLAPAGAVSTTYEGVAIAVRAAKQANAAMAHMRTVFIASFLKSPRKTGPPSSAPRKAPRIPFPASRHASVPFALLRWLNRRTFYLTCFGNCGEFQKLLFRSPGFKTAAATGLVGS